MAATSSELHQGAKGAYSLGVSSVKDLANLTSIPSSYVHHRPSNCEPSDQSCLDDCPIPIIDLSLLVSDDPEERSRMIEELGKACQDWGFFMVVNHGVAVDMMQAILDGCNEFFNLTTEEKLEFQGKHVLDPIRCGTSFNASVEKSYFWRDFLKAFVHPQFNFPNKPPGFSELANEYCSKIRQVKNELLKGISVSLGLEPSYIHKALNLESSFQVFISNLYPPCPEPDLALGMAPHSDHGILTLLIQNGIGGLQIMHKGRWVDVNPISNSFLVNTGDHLEILSNGKYKSVLHRAVVNNKATRISLAVANGPSLDTIVSPVRELLDQEENLAKYRPMKYNDYLEVQQSNPLFGKSVLDRIRI